MILARTSDAHLARLLARHPKVDRVSEGPSAGMTFSEGSRERTIVVEQLGEELYGLGELMDNNPLVCADRMSVPSPVSTLALMALGPLIEAGLLVEPPTMMVNQPIDDDAADAGLARVNWPDGLTLHGEAVDLSTVIAATVIAAIHTPSDLSDIDAIFDERYGRSFFVRRDETSAWDTALVSGQNHAVYRMRVAEDSPHSLLTIQLMADLHGKCGAAQVLHAFNVMCGFEESLGLD